MIETRKNFDNNLYELLTGKILITGINGCLGKYLSKFLLQNCRDIELYGLDLQYQSEDLSGINFISYDITNFEGLRVIIKDIEPDIIFHLAGIFNQDNLNILYQVNVVGTENLLKSCAISLNKASVILASSSAVYGNVIPSINPIKEESPINPISHYGISKATMEMIGYMHSQLSENIDIIIARIFNLIGYGLSPLLLPGKLVKEMLAASKSKVKKIIKVGNIHSVRDFIDVRDVVNALILLALNGKQNNIYNIGSGVGVSIRELINLFIETIDSSIEIVQDQSLFKKIDPEIIIADINKIRQHTGWSPIFSLEDTALDILNKQNLL